MNFGGLLYALRNLIHRKMRSWLTILSVLIGVTAIFALISFGLGIQVYVDQLAEDAGTDKLFIQARGVGAPGTDSNFFITKDDVDFVDKINGVQEVSGVYLKAGEIKYKEQVRINFLAGLDTRKQDFVDELIFVDIDEGRKLKKNDVNKVVLGYNYQIDDKQFNRGINVGDKVTINSVPMEVVGFYEEIGNPADDANIYVTYDTFEQLYPDTKDKFGYAMIKAAQSENPSNLAIKIEEKLRKFKGQEEGKEKFFVQTFADALATFGSIILVINGVLVLIALVSVLVASVNIMNTMYTAVLERTKEIGVMKAIGAQNKDILWIFVIESGFLGMVGGIIGVIFGYLIASAAGRAAAASGFASLQPVFPPFLIVASLLFAFLLGVFSGLLPARQASRLKPVEALRYE
jgi:putative ABC transport system permease protein